MLSVIGLQGRGWSRWVSTSDRPTENGQASLYNESRKCCFLGKKGRFCSRFGAKKNSLQARRFLPKAVSQNRCELHKVRHVHRVMKLSLAFFVTQVWCMLAQSQSLGCDAIVVSSNDDQCGCSTKWERWSNVKFYSSIANLVLTNDPWFRRFTEKRLAKLLAMTTNTIKIWRYVCHLTLCLLAQEVLKQRSTL